MNRDTVLICDDDEELCEFIGNYLTSRGFRAVTTSASENFLPLFEKEKPDLVLLDVQMPGMDGLSLCAKIREKHQIPILFLTGLVHEEDRLRGFDAGADDYIAKPFQFGELLARIKANLRWGKQINRDGETRNDKRTLRFAGLSVDLLTYGIVAHRQEVHLQPKEAQLLILLASNPKRLYSQDQLYSLIWGDMSESGLDTVKVHIRNVRKKIDLHPSEPAFIETVRGLGYRFVGRRENG